MCSFARGNCGLSWPTELLFGSKPKIANPIQKNVEDMGVLFQMCGLSFDGRKKEQVNWQVVGSLYTCFVETTNLSFPISAQLQRKATTTYVICGHFHPGSATFGLSRERCLPTRCVWLDSLCGGMLRQWIKVFVRGVREACA